MKIKNVNNQLACARICGWGKPVITQIPMRQIAETLAMKNMGRTKVFYLLIGIALLSVIICRL